MTPVYKHDCRKCVYKGTVLGDQGKLRDVYVCNGMFKNVVIRESSEGPDYWSSPSGLIEDARKEGFRALYRDPDTQEELIVRDDNWVLAWAVLNGAFDEKEK